MGFNRYRIEPFQFQQVQNGEGIGTFFASLLRNQILPLVPSLLKNSAGLALGVANSLANNPNNEKVASILKRHGKNALRNMAADTLDHVGLQLGRGGGGGGGGGGRQRKRSRGRGRGRGGSRNGKCKSKKKKLEFY